MLKDTRKKIELYLYNFNVLEKKINNLLLKKTLENKINMKKIFEKRIITLNNWKKLIKSVLDMYEKNNSLKYSFIVMKYFKKENYKYIENKLNLSKQEQKDIQYEILQYIFLLAKNKKILKEVEY